MRTLLVDCERCGATGRIYGGHDSDPSDYGSCPVCAGSGQEEVELHAVSEAEILEPSPAPLVADPGKQECGKVDILEMGRRWQKAWTSHRAEANNCVGDSFGQLCDEIERLRTLTNDLRVALEMAHEFVADHVDVLDGDYGEPRPNRAMQLLPEIAAALAKAEEPRP